MKNPSDLIMEGNAAVQMRLRSMDDAHDLIRRLTAEVTRLSALVEAREKSLEATVGYFRAVQETCGSTGELFEDLLSELAEELNHDEPQG